MSKIKAKVPFEDTEDIPHYLLRKLVDSYFDFQETRIQTQLRFKSAERENSLTDEEMLHYGITDVYDQVLRTEKGFEKLITKQLENHALYTQYLSKIRGVGPIIAAGLISYIDDIAKFKNVSKLWQYCGYGMNTFCPKCKKPTFVEVEYETGKIAKKLQPMDICPVCKTKTDRILQKRMTGYQSNWNDRLKVLAWKFSESIVKQPAEKSGYRRLYDEIKSGEKARAPEKYVENGKTYFNPGHIHNRTMRKVRKIFLAHLWEIWRLQKRLEISDPYPKQLLGHSMVGGFTDM